MKTYESQVDSTQQLTARGFLVVFFWKIAMCLQTLFLGWVIHLLFFAPAGPDFYNREGSGWALVFGYLISLGLGGLGSTLLGLLESALVVQIFPDFWEWKASFRRQYES